MQPRYSGTVQDKLINRLERQEKRQIFQQDRFFKFKLTEIHNRLLQVLLMEKVIETENPAAISDSLLKCLKKALNSSQFDFDYFIAPIRGLVPRPNRHSLYITQYIKEILINDPNVIEIYGMDEEIYRIVNQVVSQVSIKFERTEEEILAQLAHNKSLRPGTGAYEIELDRLNRKWGTLRVVLDVSRHRDFMNSWT
ncbi:MAG: DUF507 family protein [Deltaproteobacteria bacterium]|nr:DUF507 family protein [Deltaproteobacteria bacterium]